MTPQAPAQPEPGLASLVKGIVADLGELIAQQFKFAKTEIKSDFRKSKTAITLLAIGAGVAFFGIFFLGMTLAQLIYWLSLPAGADPAGVPLWAGYAIVTLLFLGGGGAFLMAGKKKFDSFNPLPDETAATMKENVQWMTNSK